ncbi:MAG: 2-phospho-L-lactate transferase, partial [Actinomycetes bacterium]
VAVAAGAVGRHYGARSRGGVLDTWVLDPADDSAEAEVTAAGLRAVVTPLLMKGPEVTATFVLEAVAASR